MDTQQITQNFEPKPVQGFDQQLRPGTTLFNRYLIQSLIGVGGMGAVYRARDLHFTNVEKRVAVKEMVNQIRDPLLRETIVKNFEREANILATLNHASIPRIYDYFTQSERSYLVLELVDGKDLEALLEETPEIFDTATVVKWAIELCDVLHYLHSHKPDPIIFRDMKPSNVMVNQYQHIILIDFGIAKTFQTGQRATIIGTEGYAPPEQYRGEATPLADIYALGATIHHLLTRRDPRLEAPFSFAERPIRQINSSVSPELEELINQAVHYNPENRFQSALEMKDALIEVARKTGILGPGKVPSAGTSQVEESTQVVWTFECEDEVRGTPLIHKGLIFTGCYDHNLYALDSETGAFLWKYAAEGGIVSKPAFYEGNLYFGSEDKRLHAVYSRTGKLVWTYFTDGPVRSSPYLAEGHLFIGSDDGYLHAVNALTSRRAWRVDMGSYIRSTPLVNEGLVYVGTESGDFYCLDMGGSIKWKFKSKRAITSSAVFSQGSLYFGSVDWTLYALDAKTGWVIWRYRMGKASICTPCLAENFIFTGATDGNIYCIDSRTAKEIWRYPTGHQVTGSPIIHKDSLYCGSVDGNLYCLEYRTGRLRWKFRTEGAITGTPVAQGNLVYIGSTDHRIYALTA